jgi:hypothetical protein
LKVWNSELKACDDVEFNFSEIESLRSVPEFEVGIMNLAGMWNAVG